MSSALVQSGTVQGYEFPLSLQFNDDAVYILATLKRKGIVYVQVDDSPKEWLTQLKEASIEGYFTVIHQGYDVWIIESERFELKL